MDAKLEDNADITVKSRCTKGAEKIKAIILEFDDTKEEALPMDNTSETKEPDIDTTSETSTIPDK